MKKKIMLISMCIIIFSSIVYATRIGDVVGKYFYTDIEAYINGEFIDSWNIGGETFICIEDLDKYGFNIQWNEELREFRAIFDNQPNIQPILLRQIAEPLCISAESYHYPQYKDWLTNWIQKTDPLMTFETTPHGDAVVCAGQTHEAITVEFAQKMSTEYINSKYIPVFLGNINVSNKFDYIFDEERNILKLQLVDHSIESAFGGYSIRDANGKKMVAKSFDVYFVEGISTVNGKKLPTPLRLTADIEWEPDFYAPKISDVAGEYFHTDIKAYVNGNQTDSWNVEGKTLILIGAVGDIEWNEELRKINVTVDSNSKMNLLEQISDPLYKNEYADWIESTVPEMTLATTPHDNTVEAISNAIDEITIKFTQNMSEDYINSKYIPIFHNNINVSDKFIYIFDKKENILKLKLVDHSRDFIIDHFVMSNVDVDGQRNLKGRNFDVYLLKGISTVNGDKLPTTLRLTSGVLWETEK